MHEPTDSDNRQEAPAPAPLALRDRRENVISGELLVPGEMATAIGPASAETPRRTTLAGVFRFKWTILALFVLIAGPAIPAVWLLVKPEYTAMAEVRVRPKIPHLVFRTDDNGMIPLYQSFMNTQVSLIRSPTVLGRVLLQDKVRTTHWYTDPPKRPLRQTESPLDRLRDTLTASPRRNTEIIGVSFTAGDPSEARLILDAALNEYMKYLDDATDEATKEINRKLTQQYNLLKNEIAGREATIARLRQNLGTQTPEELVSRQRVRLDEGTARLNALGRDIRVLELQRDQLREYGQDSSIHDQEVSRLLFISNVTRMSAEDRTQLRSQLEQRRDRIQAQIDEAGKLKQERDRRKAEIDPVVAGRRREYDPAAKEVEELRKKAEDRPANSVSSGTGAAAAGAAPAGAPSTAAKELAKKQAELDKLRGSLEEALARQAEATTAVKEVTTRLKLLNRQLTTLNSQLLELDRVIAQAGTAEEAAQTQPAMTHRYDEDPEWRRLNVALKTADHSVEMGRKRLKDTHPEMVELLGNVDLATELLRARESQLDRLWELQAEGANRPDGLAGGAGPQALAMVRPPEALAGQVNPMAGTGSPLVSVMPAEQQATLVGQQLELARHQWKLLNEEVEQLTKQSVKTFEDAALLESETRTLAHRQNMFAAVRTRLEEKQMEGNVPVVIEVLTAAISPSNPSKDRRVVFTLMALVAGLGAGVGVAFLRANTTQSMHAAEELPRPLQAPFLGKLPLVRRAKDVFDSNPVMVENIRMVRTALLSRMGDQKGSTVMISSADIGAGKSTVAVMLGRSLAECGKNVLLIDADLRRSSLSQHFGLDGEPGLMDCLARRDDRRQTVFPTNTARLSVMPSGQSQDIAEIELIANGAFAAFMDRLSKEYDIILLDSSPILPVADARILSRQVDGTILVVREEKSRRADVVEALACLGSAGGKLLGTIFIGTDRGERSSYDSYYYCKGRRKA